MREEFDHSFSISPITYPTARAESYEIKLELILIIQREAFAGDPENNPYQHIENFTTLCSMVRLPAWRDDERKLILFPFSLKGKAKEWLYSKPDVDFTSWQGISNAFLSYYYSQKEIYERRFDIMSFKQSNNEDLPQSYNRFFKLLCDFPSHGLPSWLLLKIFYGGLNQSSKDKLDMTSQGCFNEKTVDEAWQLLNKIKYNFSRWHRT
jgi:hypothetical protein